MAAFWRARFKFVDVKGLQTTRTHVLETAGADLSLEIQDVLLATDEMLADYRAVSDAAVSLDLAVVDDAWTGDAVTGDAEISNVAHVNVRLDDQPDGKLASLAIPAPIDALFVGGVAGTEVDISNAALIDLVANFETDFEISDGENVDTTLTNGIKDGEWRSRRLNPR